MARYATATEVKSFLQLPTAFSADTTPTQTEVEKLLDYNTKKIDRKTGHNFDGTASETEEFHLKKPQYSSREGYAIFLSNRKIKTLDSGEGDSLTIWNGSENEDYLTNRTEGRNNDFWLDYNMGILYIKTFRWTSPRFFSVNIVYRYGENSVPDDIKKACILMTAIDLAGSDDRSLLFPDNQSSITLSQKIENWTKEIDDIIRNRKEIKVIGGL